MKITKSTWATITGFGIAIIAAWETVDWANFTFDKEWPKLAISALIAAKGYFTEYKGG